MTNKDAEAIVETGDTSVSNKTTGGKALKQYSKLSDTIIGYRFRDILGITGTMTITGVNGVILSGEDWLVQTAKREFKVMTDAEFSAEYTNTGAVDCVLQNDEYVVE